MHFVMAIVVPLMKPKKTVGREQHLEMEGSVSGYQTTGVKEADTYWKE